MPPEVPGNAEPLALRLAFAVALALFLWSNIGGAIYVLAVDHRLPLYLDPLAEARARVQKGDLAGGLRQYRVYTQLRTQDAAAVDEMNQIAAYAARLTEEARALEADLAANPSDARAAARLADLRKVLGRRVP
jgi:hypothetical protein